MKVIISEDGEIVEKDGYFELGNLKLKFEELLNLLCDLGYEEVRINCKTAREKEFEWETPTSIIKKLKKKKGREKCGAIALFVGFVRELNEGKKVKYLEYEVNRELYEKTLEKLKKRIESMEGIEGVEIFHKEGRVMAGEDIVYVAVMGRSRRHVYSALIEAVEGMKKELPIWKKEVFDNGEVWV